VAVEGTVARPSRAAIDHVWRELLRRLGLSPAPGAPPGAEPLGVTLHYGEPAQVKGVRPSVVVMPCREESWSDLLARPPAGLHWRSEGVVPASARLPLDLPVPAILWGKGRESGQAPFAEQTEEGLVVFNADILSAALFMLSRWEESRPGPRDAHGRFPATASVALRQGFLDRPIVDEYALILGQWLSRLRPAWHAAPAPGSLELSHDIDSLRRFRGPRAAARGVASALLRRRDPIGAWQSFREGLTELLRPEDAVNFRGVAELAELSRRRGLRSTFYVMTGEPRPPDSDFRWNWPPLRTLIGALREGGCEIGLHPSYRACEDAERLRAEKARLDELLGETYYGSRQHFLRFKVPATWRMLEDAGLRSDATVGYADHEGFRTGTCHPFRPFDLDRDRELTIWERPLVVMDATLRHYRRLDPAAAGERLDLLYRRCDAVGGALSVLWHNSSLHGCWAPWAAAYRKLLESSAVSPAG
jgi:hypothetical protein